MIRNGENIVSVGMYSLYASVVQAVIVDKAPATVVVYNYSGVYSVKLPKACDSAGQFVYVRAEIATATNYVRVNPASGDRILSGSTVVDLITLDAYTEATLLFSDGLFWYTC